jgi:hypothetical protein
MRAQGEKEKDKDAASTKQKPVPFQQEIEVSLCAIVQELRTMTLLLKTLNVSSLSFVSCQNNLMVLVVFCKGVEPQVFERR